MRTGRPTYEVHVQRGHHTLANRLTMLNRCVILIPKTIDHARPNDWPCSAKGACKTIDHARPKAPAKRLHVKIELKTCIGLGRKQKLINAPMTHMLACTACTISAPAMMRKSKQEEGALERAAQHLALNTCAYAPGQCQTMCAVWNTRDRLHSTMREDGQSQRQDNGRKFDNNEPAAQAFQAWWPSGPCVQYEFWAADACELHLLRITPHDVLKIDVAQDAPRLGPLRVVIENLGYRGRVLRSRFLGFFRRGLPHTTGKDQGDLLAIASGSSADLCCCALPHPLVLLGDKFFDVFPSLRMRPSLRTEILGWSRRHDNIDTYN
jgi:hypothetical protein